MIFYYYFIDDSQGKKVPAYEYGAYSTVQWSHILLLLVVGPFVPGDVIIHQRTSRWQLRSYCALLGGEERSWCSNNNNNRHFSFTVCLLINYTRTRSHRYPLLLLLMLLSPRNHNTRAAESLFCKNSTPSNELVIFNTWPKHPVTINHRLDNSKLSIIRHHHHPQWNSLPAVDWDIVSCGSRRRHCWPESYTCPCGRGGDVAIANASLNNSLDRSHCNCGQWILLMLMLP